MTRRTVVGALALVSGLICAVHAARPADAGSKGQTMGDAGKAKGDAGKAKGAAGRAMGQCLKDLAQAHKAAVQAAHSSPAWTSVDGAGKAAIMQGLKDQFEAARQGCRSSGPGKVGTGAAGAESAESAGEAVP